VSRVAFHVVEPDGSIEEESEVALAPADVVVANILARPLVELAPRIAALAKRGNGQIVLAGLLEEQVR
jgi:ribosomal protein L11 methyltransferase